MFASCDGAEFVSGSNTLATIAGQSFVNNLSTVRSASSEATNNLPQGQGRGVSGPGI